MHMTVPLRSVSDYCGHTTGICIKVINYECSLLIPLCSIKSHPIDLMTDRRMNLRVTKYSRQCLFESITFNINYNPLITKSNNMILQLPNIFHVSLFDRILLRKISSGLCIYSLLLIVNGIGHNIDQADTPREVDLAIASPDLAIEANDYAEMI